MLLAVTVFTTSPHGLHGLADRPLSVRRDGLDGLYVLEDAVHHLTAGGGDGLGLLGGTIGHPLGRGLHRAGHAVGYLGRGLGDGGQHLAGSFFDLGVAQRHALRQTGAGLYTNLGEHAGRRVDAQHLFHDVGQLLGEALNLRDETRPAGFQAVPQTGDDLAADVQPAEGREHVKDGLADLGDVLDDGRQCLQQAPAQHDDEVRTQAWGRYR